MIGNLKEKDKLNINRDLREENYMYCSKCKFYRDGYMYNACTLFESEYFREHTTENPCIVVSDNYTALKDEEAFEIKKGDNLLPRVN